MNETSLKILFFGDIAGRAGRNAVKYYLSQNRGNYDFIIANAENASHGFGLTQKNYEDLISSGINCLTSGNHIWDKKEIFTYIEQAQKLIRPLNYPKNTAGNGYGIFDVGEYFAKIYHAAAFTADPRPDRHHIFILCHDARGWK